ncbi:MAG: M20/M25/M40 family metallo-hydrolase, partial [Pseudomonadota bacterium]|nr:M20/M25/M40 family metallo-hydrolase [Pseudomonadota bacterium]
MKSKIKWILISLQFIYVQTTLSDASLDKIINYHQQEYEKIALKIWDLAEVGYQEYESSGLLKESLKNKGFKIKTLPYMPTAFIAEYGKGSPVIAILGEFDALPGISQSALPFKEKYKSNLAGHACGHHLFGAGSAWSAVTIKEWLSKNNKSGTIRFYGTPAEEGGSGKVYMVREGLFKDVDVVLHWHPGSVNHANPRTSNA